MEKYGRWRDKPTGIHPFLPPSAALSSTDLALLPLALPLAVVRLILLLASGFSIIIVSLFTSILPRPLRRLLDRFVMALLCRLALFALGFVSLTFLSLFPFCFYFPLFLQHHFGGSSTKSERKKKRKMTDQDLDIRGGCEHEGEWRASSASTLRRCCVHKPGQVREREQPLRSSSSSSSSLHRLISVHSGYADILYLAYRYANPAFAMPDEEGRVAVCGLAGAMREALWPRRRSVAGPIEAARMTLRDAMRRAEDAGRVLVVATEGASGNGQCLLRPAPGLAASLGAAELRARVHLLVLRHVRPPSSPAPAAFQVISPVIEESERERESYMEFLCCFLSASRLAASFGT